MAIYLKQTLAFLILQGLVTYAVAEESLLRRVELATVLVECQRDGTMATASGTVIEREGSRSHIATCAHVFRHLKGPVTVTFFTGSKPMRRPATPSKYDQHLDAGFLVVEDAPPTPVFPLASRQRPHTIGERVVVAGCDFGLRPVVEQASITAIDRFAGRPNIEVNAKPEQGRSGGGLVTTDGFLIGVCNGYYPDEKEGVYARTEALHLVREAADREVAREVTPSRPPQLVDNPILPSQVTTEHKAHSNDQVMCVVSDTESGTPKYYVITNPSAKLLKLLRQEGRRLAPE